MPGSRVSQGSNDKEGMSEDGTVIHIMADLGVSILNPTTRWSAPDPPERTVPRGAVRGGRIFEKKHYGKK